MPETQTKAYVVTAEWRARPGAQDRVAELCDELTMASRGEPGNAFFKALRAPTDPQLFYLYEEYVDEAAYQAHLESEHFRRLVEHEAIPELLEADACERFEAASRLINLSPAGRHAGSTLRAFLDQAPPAAAALDRVIGSAVVLDLTPVAAIDAAALDRAEARLHAAAEAIRPRDILLLRTDWTERTLHNPSLTPDAARWLVARGPSCIGCDFYAAGAPVQRHILEAGIALVDGLVNLAALPARCEFFAPWSDFGAARAFAWAWEAA